MDTIEKPKFLFKHQELWHYLHKLLARVTLVLAPLVLYSFIQLIRGGGENYIILLAGSILSVTAIFGYIFAEMTFSIKKQKSYLAMILFSMGFIPWVFGCYLVFYKGLWSLTEVNRGYWLIGVIKSLIYIIIGYVVVQRFYKITEIGRQISNGEIAIEEIVLRNIK